MAVGLPDLAANLRDLDPRHRPEPPRWRRLHQEDFAQILGFAPTAKYDVTWKQCFALLSAHASTPAVARVELVDRLLFNLLLGNNDAHAKNFALLHTQTGAVELSPAYDLVCTQMYRSLSPRLAMSIGSATDLKGLTPAVWKAFARDVGIGFPLIRRRALEMSARVEEQISESAACVVRENPALARDVYPVRRRTDFFRAFSKVIAANCRLIGRTFNEA